MNTFSVKTVLSSKKKFLFYLILIILTLVLTEATAQALYRIGYDQFVWETNKGNFTRAEEVFSVRDFIRLVDDRRYYVPKKNYRYVHPGSQTVFTFDENGFREGLHTYSVDKNNIVFLGDSVPFGWKINDDQTLPSKFYELLAEGHTQAPYGVINAAVPSYSLDQAVQRYKRDIHRQFPVSHIFLQVYAPVPQFEAFGREWHRDLNWYTTQRLDAPPYPIFEYSALYWLITESKRAVISQNRGLRLDDSVASERFEAGNIRSLDQLRALAEEDGAQLILQPVNIPKYAGENEIHKAAIRKFNEILKSYAEAHPDVYYFEVRSYLHDFNSTELFIDKCCHLSETGTELQANFLREQLITHYLLENPELSPSHEWRILENLQSAAEYVAAEAKSGEALIGVDSTPPLERYIVPLRQDLLYLDRETTTLPDYLLGRWYAFQDVEMIPNRWSQDKTFESFDDVVVVYQPGACQADDCINQTASLLLEMAQTNPDSILAKKIFAMLSRIENLAVSN